MQNVLGAAAADKRWNSQSQSDVKADKTGGKYNFAGTVAAKTEEKHQFYPIPNKELSCKHQTGTKQMVEIKPQDF